MSGQHATQFCFALLQASVHICDGLNRNFRGLYHVITASAPQINQPQALPYILRYSLL